MVRARQDGPTIDPARRDLARPSTVGNTVHPRVAPASRASVPAVSWVPSNPDRSCRPRHVAISRSRVRVFPVRIQYS